MKEINKLSQQIAKVRAKIAELREVEEAKDEINNTLTQAYANDWQSMIEDLRDEYLALAEKCNRIGGIIKRMSRKAIELYYGGECYWFNYEFTYQYINKFNETFQYWN